MKKDKKFGNLIASLEKMDGKTSQIVTGAGWFYTHAGTRVWIENPDWTNEAYVAFMLENGGMLPPIEIVGESLEGDSWVPSSSFNEFYNGFIPFHDYDGDGFFNGEQDYQAWLNEYESQQDSGNSNSGSGNSNDTGDEPDFVANDGTPEGEILAALGNGVSGSLTVMGLGVTAADIAGGFTAAEKQMLGQFGRSLGIAGFILTNIQIGIEVYEEESIDLQDAINWGVAGVAIFSMSAPIALVLGVGALALTVYGDDLFNWADEMVLYEWGDDEPTTGNAYDLYHSNPSNTTVDIYGY